VVCVFAVYETIVGARYEIAVGRLVREIKAGSLDGASRTAYEGGLAELRTGRARIATEPAGLARVRFLGPVVHRATMTVPLRWETAGAAGDLFPVLDADLILAADGAAARLALTGTYRPFLCQAGSAPDRAALHRIATATVRSFVRGFARGLSLG
jgi:hypothetical protein